MAKVLRTLAFFAGFDLTLKNNRVTVPTPAGVALVISARKAYGTWAAGGLSVRYMNGVHGPYEFESAAKDVPAGGGRARLSETDMAGVSAVEVSLDTAEAAGENLADIEVSVEEEE